MPRVIETTVYLYNELNDKAKAKARDWYREASVGDTYFAEHLTDPGCDFDKIAGFCGWQIDASKYQKGALAIHWSGFSSQGDGLHFEGSWSGRDVNVNALREFAPEEKALHDIALRLNALARAIPGATGKARQRDRHYCHEYTVGFELEPDADNEAQELTREHEKELADASRALMQYMYRAIEQAYDYDNSDEHVAETIVANDYEFLESGKHA